MDSIIHERVLASLESPRHAGQLPGDPEDRDRIIELREAITYAVAFSETANPDIMAAYVASATREADPFVRRDSRAGLNWAINRVRRMASIRGALRPEPAR
jgi:hypothetical protein